MAKEVAKGDGDIDMARGEMAFSLTTILSTAFKLASCYFEKRDGGREMAKGMTKGDGRGR